MAAPVIVPRAEHTLTRRDIDPDALTAAMSTAGFVDLGRTEYPLPNGKTLVRPDFRTPSGSARTSAAD